MSDAHGKPRISAEHYETGYDPDRDPAVQRELALIEALREFAKAAARLPAFDRNESNAVVVPSELDRQAARKALHPTAARSGLLTPHEAADYCRVSKRTFDRNVASYVRRVKVGTSVRYDKEELDRWLDDQKVGASPRTSAPESTWSGSGKQGESELDPQERAFLRRLRGGRRKSTKK